MDATVPTQRRYRPAPEAPKAEIEARRTRDLAALLARRAELRGVHAMADLVDDAVRWTA